jgi:hypothetical protein
MNIYVFLLHISTMSLLTSKPMHSLVRVHSTKVRQMFSFLVVCVAGKTRTESEYIVGAFRRRHMLILSIAAEFCDIADEK